MSSKISQSSMHGDGIGNLRARLGNLTGLISETPVKPTPFSSTVAARQYVEGTVSAVKSLLYVHVRVLVQTMMVETMRESLIVSDNDNSCERP